MTSVEAWRRREGRSVAERSTRSPGSSYLTRFCAGTESSSPGSTTARLAAVSVGPPPRRRSTTGRPIRLGESKLGLHENPRGAEQRWPRTRPQRHQAHPHGAWARARALAWHLHAVEDIPQGPPRRSRGDRLLLRRGADLHRAAPFLRALRDRPR